MATTFSFRVGVEESHEVTVNVAGVRHVVTISVDGHIIITGCDNLGILMSNVFDLEVGFVEKHMVSVRFIAAQVVDGGATYIDVFVDGRFAFRHPW